MFTRARPIGLWIPNSVVDPEEFEHLDDYHLAVDGTGGGEYEPSAAIGIGGAGLGLAGTAHELRAGAVVTVQNTAVISIASGGKVKAEGTSTADIELKVVAGVALLDVESGAAIRVKAGAALDVFGSLTLKNTSGPGSFTAEDNTTITLADGSSMTAANGASVTHAAGSALTIATNPTLSGDMTVTGTGSIVLQSSATITGASGSTVTLQGETNLYEARLVGLSSWLKFVTPRDWTRRKYSIALTTHNAGDTNGSPDDPDTWFERSNLANTPMLRTRSETATGASCLLEWEDLPPGGEIAQVDVTSRGSVASPDEYPKYVLVRWQDGENNMQVLSVTTTDHHSVSGNFDSDMDTTTITPISTVIIDPTWRYGLYMFHTYKNTGAWSYVYDAAISGTVVEQQI